MSYIIGAIAPVVAILIYIYYRDKWEKEPLRKLLSALALGALSVIPVLIVEIWLHDLSFNLPLSKRLDAFYNAFVVAAFTEESFKFIALLIIVWRSRQFSEKYDGIVYAVFVSLGFAMVENIKYVLDGGMNVALTRAITAVPAHALFGVTMGYYLSFARFSLFFKRRNFILALLIPIMLHGIYDFILMSAEPGYFIVFIFYLYYLYKVGFKRIKELSNIKRTPN
ncbi:MAG: PrsW family intramembrane metalloprotease [Bacteroidales bacterium]|nr:PrsW family intramembrane metalloprotease [Bacteroidales bacterium]